MTWKIRTFATAIVVLILGVAFWANGNAGYLAKFDSSGLSSSTINSSMNESADGNIATGSTATGGTRFRATAYNLGDFAGRFENFDSGGNVYVKLGGSSYSNTAGVFMNGNVGIGTTAPGHTLQVETAAAGQAAGFFRNLDGGQDVHVRLANAAVVGTAAVFMGGNVGIGTETPDSSAKLHVVGSIKVDGNINAKWQDVAEWVDARGRLQAGTVVVIAEGEDVVQASQKDYDTAVAGVVSLNPGLILGTGGPGRALVAHSGRVRVDVDATYGAIAPGDLLVTSPTAGYAMKSEPVDVGGVPLHRPGTVLGKALEPLASGKGQILVLLTLQ